MTSPQRPRAAATPIASPEGVTAERDDLIERLLDRAHFLQGADAADWREEVQATVMTIRDVAAALAAQAQRRDEVVEALRKLAWAPLPPRGSEAEVVLCTRINGDLYEPDEPSALTLDDFRNGRRLTTPEPK